MSAEAMDECSLLLANRSFVYALLARAFAEEPDQLFCDIFCAPHAEEELSLVVDEHSSELEGCWTRAVRALEAAGLAGIRHEYVRIFVGPGDLPARPWESTHVTGKSVLFQPEVLDVRAAYRAAGMAPMRLRAVSDDFIGLELDFMAKLAARACEEPGCAAEALQHARAFLDEHLLRWLSPFADAVVEHYPESFYAPVARMAALFAQRDAAVLESMV